MNIIKASELNTGCTRQDVVEWMTAKVMGNIQRANKEGRRKTVFYAGCCYWDKDEKKFTYNKGEDRPFFHWDDYKDEVREIFIDAGYKIKPTGYIGGVWQDSEDIMW